MNGDGRLDLDDLGGVIERASSIDEPADVVGEEGGRTWAERFEGAGLTPWLRRHRVAVAAGAAAVIAVGVGATAWVRAQPPAWHEPTVDVISATLDSDYGTGLRVPGDGTGTAAYLAVADDPSQTVRIDGVEGPGIRAATVGPALASGNPRSEVVRAAFGCDDDALTSAPDDYRLRLTVTDAWGRSATSFATPPSDGIGWREAVVQNCWRLALATRVTVGDVVAQADAGAGAVTLQVTLTSTVPGQVLALADSYTAETSIAPTGIGTDLPAGEPTPVAARLDVWDCSAGTPPLPQVSYPIDPTNPTSYTSSEGVGMQVYSPDRQAWGVVPVVFTLAQAAGVRRALAQVCAGAPAVRVNGEQVVRQLNDDGSGNASLVLVVDVVLPPGRLAQVGIAQDYSIASPDPATTVWWVTPRGGGRAEATWTFSCFAAPVPPALDVRFVDGVRATPVRVPLDQAALARRVSDACPDLTSDRLIETGWQLR